MDKNEEAIARNPNVVWYIATLILQQFKELEKISTDAAMLWLRTMETNKTLMRYDYSLRSINQADVSERITKLARASILNPTVIISSEISNAIQIFYKYPEALFRSSIGKFHQIVSDERHNPLENDYIISKLIKEGVIKSDWSDYPMLIDPNMIQKDSKNDLLGRMLSCKSARVEQAAMMRSEYVPDGNIKFECQNEYCDVPDHRENNKKQENEQETEQIDDMPSLEEMESS